MSQLIKIFTSQVFYFEFHQGKRKCATHFENNRNILRGVFRNELSNRVPLSKKKFLMHFEIVIVSAERIANIFLII